MTTASLTEHMTMMDITSIMLMGDNTGSSRPTGIIGNMRPITIIRGVRFIRGIITAMMMTISSLVLTKPDVNIGRGYGNY